MIKNLTELKAKYEDLRNKINTEKANGDLGKLINLRGAFDETFDSFFDDAELRKKYDAWKDEENEPNFDISNNDLEEMLDIEDVNALCEFYRNYIGRLEDELRDLIKE